MGNIQEREDNAGYLSVHRPQLHRDLFLKPERESSVTNSAELERKAKSLDKLTAEIKAGPGLVIPKLFFGLQRLTQHSVKLIRWVRYCLWNRPSQNDALPKLRALYARF